MLFPGRYSDLIKTDYQGVVGLVTSGCVSENHQPRPFPHAFSYLMHLSLLHLS